ncbi:MAG TPA: acyl-CoA dehydrogenase family protein, partial [Rhodocyclaceae bacterium]|nr:acyl-CoA dehydrogenase family protein [Rhodocyclaceae bacterium]
MNFEPTAEQSAAREMARTFANREIKPYWREREAEARFHRDLIEKMAAAGMFGCLFPEDFGGNGLGFVAQVLIMEEMMRASIESGMPFNQQGVNVPMAIYRWGTDEQKRRYVPSLVSARYIGAFGLTEPGGGSDSAGMKTRAVRHGDRYIINGAKLWITYGSVADVILLFAKTDPARG